MKTLTKDHIIPFISNVQNREIHRDRTQIDGDQRMERGRDYLIVKGFCFGVMEIFWN